MFLGAHDWVTFRGAPRVLTAPPSRAKAAIAAEPRIVADAMWFLREVIKDGAGIGPLPTFMADAEVAAGTLVRVLPRWVAASGTAYFVHPGRKHVPAKVTAFRDLLMETFRHRPLSVPENPRR